MPSYDESDLPTFDDVLQAADRLRGHIVPTPLLESPLLNEKLGGRLLVKTEVLQRTSSFKFRGAFNRLTTLDDAAKRRGVLSISSGNHAQGIAAAARELGIPAVLVMPRDAPERKQANTRAYGADIVFCEREENREPFGMVMAKERNLTFVSSFDDPYIIAGHGTVGLELTAQAAAMGEKIDALLVPVSGGEFIAGCALAITHESPGTKVYSVEPAGFDDTKRSLEAGHPVSNEDPVQSICDALLMPAPGDLTFAINVRLLAGGVAVSDDQVLDAMAASFQHLKLVVEPGGAAALAAVLSGVFDCRGKTVVVVCSGGNVDPAVFRSALERIDVA